MSYVNIEWDYNEVQSIISAVDRASTTLKNVPTPSTANTGSAHHATLIKHLTALDTTISQMAWITNGISLGLGAATEDFQCTDNGRRRHARNPALQRRVHPQISGPLLNRAKASSHLGGFTEVTSSTRHRRARDHDRRDPRVSW